MSFNVDSLLAKLGSAPISEISGRVRSVVGLAIRASIPGVTLGEVVHIERRNGEPLLAEVVGFSDDEATLMPLGESEGVGADDVVRPTGGQLRVRVGDALLGRVVDGLGRPMDGGPPIEGTEVVVQGTPPNPMERPRISRALSVGIKVIDGFLTVGEGQRVGLFAGSGVGKSSLLGQIARQSEADVFVTCLIGERGRELREFLEDSLGADGMRRGVVVCATSDTPALVRLKSAHVATAIAEHFRDQGKRVILLMDSLSRFARAGREVGLAAGEPPARRGYPPSVFASLPPLLERSGTAKGGSITAFYTVLVEGGDMEEPIADEVRGILDGHIVLDRNIAARGLYPAVDVLASLSRVMESVTTPEHQSCASRLRRMLAVYAQNRDIVALGAYQKGTNRELDEVLARVPKLEGFLRQKREESCGLPASVTEMAALLRG